MMSFVSTSRTDAAEQPLNLLFFGNSYSQGGVQWRVADLAAADGHARPLVLLDSMGGMDLTYHIGEVNTYPANNVNHASIAGKTWTHIIIQGHSLEATKYGDNVGFKSDALSLYRLVRDHASGRGVGAKAVLFETWARGPGNDFYTRAVPAYPDPAAMQADISGNYEAAAQGIAAAEGAANVLLARAGTAFAADGFNSSLYQADTTHPTNAGTLLASMMIYRTIYGETVSDISYAAAKSWAGVDETTWNRLSAVADGVHVPEPATAGMIGVAAATLALRRPRRKIAASC